MPRKIPMYEYVCWNRDYHLYTRSWFDEWMPLDSGVQCHQCGSSHITRSAAPVSFKTVVD